MAYNQIIYHWFEEIFQRKVIVILLMLWRGYFTETSYTWIKRKKNISFFMSSTLWLLFWSSPKWEEKKQLKKKTSFCFVFSCHVVTHSNSWTNILIDIYYYVIVDHPSLFWIYMMWGIDKMNETSIHFVGITKASINYFDNMAPLSIL